MHQPFFSHGLSAFFQRPPDRFAPDILDDFPLDQALFEQLQAPALAALGRSRTGEGNQMRLLLPVQCPPLPVLLLLVPRGGQHAPLCRPRSHLADRQRSTTELLGDLAVFKADLFVAHVAQQQDAGAHLLSDATAVGAGDALQLPSLLLGQGDDVLLGWHEVQIPR